jgi:PAS domain S-box-containing protein
MNKLYSRHNIIISLIISLLVVLFFVWYTYENMTKARTENRIVNTRLQSLKAMEDLMDDIQNIETGNRGYIVSGDKKFLLSYYSGLQNLKKDTFLITNLFPLFPERVNTLEHLLVLVKRKADFAIQSVNGLGETDGNAAVGALQSTQGRQLMDSIQQTVLVLENEDRAVLRYSNKEREVAAVRSARLFGVLAIIFVIILIILFIRILRDFKKHSFNEKEISHLAGIVEQATDAIISTDQSLVIVSWNKGAEEMYGYSKEEVIGKKYHHLLKSRVSVADRQKIIEVLKESGHFSEELEYTRKNDYIIFVQASFSLLRDKNNNITGASIVHRDITEKREAEKLLVQFNEKLNTQVREKTLEINDVLERFNIITRATNDVVWDADLKKGTVWWNENFCEKFGYTINPETTSPSFWDNHLHPEDKSRVVGHINHVLNETNEVVWNNEYRFLKSNGDYVNILDRSYVMRDEQGKAVRLIGSMADVSDLFKIRNELNQSEEKYRMLVDQATDGIIVTDPAGKFLLVNTSACKISKFSKEELMTMSIYDLADNEELKAKPFHFEELNAGKNVITERRFLNKEGQYVDIEVNARLLGDGRLLTFIRDITEKKKAEEEIVKSNARFHILSKATSDIVWDWSIPDDTLWWNDNYYSKLGFNKQKEVVPIDDWFSKIHPDDIQEVKDKRQQALAGNDSAWRDEYQYIKSDGSYLHFLDRGYIMRNKEGNAYRMIGSMTDITDLYLAGEELKKSEERYRSLIEQAGDAIMIYSFDGVIHTFNLRAASLMGYTPEEFSKLNLRDILVGDLIKNTENHTKLMNGETITFSRQFKSKDGSLMETEITARILSDGKVIAFGRDITERKKAEINQQRQFDELRQLYSLSVLIDREKDIEKIYGHAIDSLLKGVKADRSAIFLLDEDGVMRHKASKGLSTDYLKAKEGHSPWKDSTDTPSLIFIEETASTTELGEIKDIVVKEGIASLGFIPLIFHGRLIGKFMIYYNEPHHFSDNEIQFAKTVAHNIAFSVERNRSDEALQASENRYHSLVEQAADAIALYDGKGKILEVNDSALHLLGYKYSELMNLHLSDILTPEEINTNPVQYDLLDKGVSTIKQRKMRRKDGSIVITEVNSKILPDGRFLSMVRDLTDRIEAQKQIEKEKELSDNIIDSLPGIFYLFDQNGKYLRWNKHLEIVSGYSAKEIAEMHPTRFFEGEEVNYIVERIGIVFREGISDAEAYFVTKDKTKIPYFFKAILVDYEGKPCLLGTGIDISDRKKAEEELNNSYKSIRELTSHLQNVREEDRVHIAREIHDELGQQLTVLKMDISWINKRISTDDALIKEKMKSLLLMLDDTVQSVRRISAELRPSLLDDLGLVAAMEWQLHEFKRRSDIKTNFTAPEDELGLSDMVKTGLFRIFQESLTNVVRHSNAKNLRVSLENIDNSIILTIADDGKGFDKDKIVNKRTLGILGMKERSAMIGGTYDIVSMPGKGTTVVIAIPVSGQN